jgi:benzodiazapine receptor
MTGTEIPAERPIAGQWVRLVLALAAVLAVAGLAGFLTGLHVDDWYPRLRKPSWNPPASVFGPVWTALYLSIAVSAWLAWRKLPFHGGWPLGLFAVQLLLNGAWSWIFFGLRRPDLAFGEIVLLWIAIAATAWSFRRVSKAAAFLLIPYLLWVGFAAALNLAIWRLNA